MLIIDFNKKTIIYLFDNIIFFFFFTKPIHDLNKIKGNINFKKRHSHS
jgi:hypothetical protein